MGIRATAGVDQGDCWASAVPKLQSCMAAELRRSRGPGQSKRSVGSKRSKVRPRQLGRRCQILKDSHGATLPTCACGRLCLIFFYFFFILSIIVSRGVWWNLFHRFHRRRFSHGGRWREKRGSAESLRQLEACIVSPAPPGSAPPSSTSSTTTQQSNVASGPTSD